MDFQNLSAICEVLQATQSNDDSLRTAAVAKLQEAKENNANQLVQALAMVLAAGGNVGVAIRQEAAVLLRQRVVHDYDELQEDTKKGLKTQLLVSVQSDSEKLVRSNAGSVVSAVAKQSDSLDELMKNWPELLPWIATQSTTGETPVRQVALSILKDLAPEVGAEMISKGQVKEMLQKALSDQAAEIRAAGVQLIFAFIQYLEQDALDKLSDAMPPVISVLQGLATGSTETELNVTLGCLVAAAEQEPGFFWENSFQALWETLLTICNADPATFQDPEVRHCAMEAMMELSEGNSDEEDFKQYLESIVEVNFRWMVPVEEDIAAWVAEGRETGEDGDIDDDCVRIGEENFDRLATHFDEDDIVSIIFKVINSKINANANWNEIRSAIMCLSQIVEHCDDESCVDQCVDFLLRFSEHPHPRVRYVFFTSIAQCSYDQADRINEKYVDSVMPKILKGLRDDNIRVVIAAAEAFTAIGDDMDSDDIREYSKELLELLVQHLDKGDSKFLQEKCIEAIAVAAEAAEEEFGEFYPQIMPLLKQVIKMDNADMRLLRGKAFECASEVGKAVGKDMFGKDACECMDLIIPMFQVGFAADDKAREMLHTACGNIVNIIGKDFKAYVPALLPSVFGVLKQTPKDITDVLEDDDNDLDDWILNDLGAMGLKTSVVEEMDDAMELLCTLIKSIEQEFCEFIGPSCEVLLPLLDYPMSEDVRETLFKVWGRIASLARAGAENNRLSPDVIRSIVSEFLKKTVGDMGKGNPADIVENNLCTLARYQTLANGSAEVISNAGAGVLTGTAMTDVCKVVGQLLAAIEVSADSPADGKTKKKKHNPESIDEEDYYDEDYEEDPSPTPQSVRYALVDIMGAIMKTNPAEFGEHVLPSFMQLVGKLLAPSSSEADRGLGFHIADNVCQHMGPGSTKYWGVFMNHALVGVSDKSPLVQRYSAKVVGSGAKQPQFAQCALAAAQAVFTVLQKQGQKHKRRRAKPEQNPSALAVDACVSALGSICEYHEQTMGEHAVQAWSTWLSALPVKYDVELAVQAHSQLLGLIARQHVVIVDPSRLPSALAVLLDAYKTKLSEPELDKNIAGAIVAIGPEKLEQLCSNLKDGQKKKIENILKKASKA